jgi:hypothetical protein
MPYAFQYDFNDGYGMSQDREETKDEYGNVKGSYGYKDPAGIYRKVEYTAGADGFKAVVSSNEPGLGTTDNPADTVFNVREPPAGSYGSRSSKSSYGGSSGGQSGAYSKKGGGGGGSYSSSSSTASATAGSYGGSSGGGGGGGGGYGGGQSQQLQTDYSNIITKIAHRTGGRSSSYFHRA